MLNNYINRYLQEACEITKSISTSEIEKMIAILQKIYNRDGRLFIIGVGGGAGNATHAVNDFRKIAGIESYSPLDNISELTARINDDGWEHSFSKWLLTSRINEKDGILVFSVGGGNEEKNISVNIVSALKIAKEKRAAIMGIVGRDGGYTAKVADACVIIPAISADTVTPHTEEFQAVVWHMIVSHPDIKKMEMKWESVK